MASRILLVDDDPALLEALSGMVHLRMEADVDTCLDSIEALERISTTDYDAIVSDIRMPRLDGWALMAKIHEIRPDTPTIIMSGHEDRQMDSQDRESGACIFIPKPINRDDFIVCLKKAIGLRHRHNKP